MRTVYQAFDGAIFDNEYDCMSYEIRQKIKNGIDIKIFNSENKELPLNIDTIESADIIYVGSQEGVDFMKEVEDFWSGFFPDCTGKYFFDRESCEWVLMENEMDYEQWKEEFQMMIDEDE